MRKSRPRRGATTVEFAVVAPVFFLILLAMFEFARLNVLRHTADNAAYEAARAAMVPGASATDARNEANRLLSTVGAQGASITIDPGTITRGTQQVTVTIDVPLSRNGWVVPRFTAGKTLTSKSTLRTERVTSR